MKVFLSTILFLAFLFVVSESTFVAFLQGTPGNAFPSASGTVVFTQQDTAYDGVNLTVSLCGLVPNSTHGVHIHTYGDLTSPVGENTGGHYDPYNTGFHSCTGNGHAGDVGNITIGANGCATQDYFLPHGSLNATDTGYLLGRGFIVHALPDTCVQPTGAAGLRILQGVIGLQVGATIPGTLASTKPTLPLGVALFQQTTLAPNNITGTAYFTPTSNGVLVTIYATGVPVSSVHGIQIETFGDITAGDGSNTGTFFDPYNVGDSCSSIRVAGDLGNFTADANGVLLGSFLNPNTSLIPDAENSIIGRSIVIYQYGEDCQGNAGNKIAMGVIGIGAAPTVTPPSAIAVLNPFSTATTYAGAHGQVVVTGVQNGYTPGLNFQISVTGLPPNTGHGIHVHQYGDLTSSTAAGVFYNPANVPHACIGTRPVGQLGNIYSDSNGNVNVSIFSELASLNPANIGFVGGRAIIIDDLIDDCSSTGNTGSNVLGGVIGYQFNSYALPEYGNFSVTNNIQAVCTFLGNITGNVTFTPADQGGTNVYFYISGLTPSSTHGIHIHAFGDISSPAGLNAGGHFNPANVNHSCPYNPVRHVGDMGNFTATSKGQVLALFYNSLATLNVMNNASIIGLAVVIHANPDNCGTVDNGQAGPRIAQCTIGYTATATRYDPTPTNPQPTNPPTPSPSSATLLIPGIFLTFLSSLLIFLL